MLFRPDLEWSGRFSLPAALPFPATAAPPAPPAPPAFLAFLAPPASPASPAFPAPPPAPSRGFAYRSSRDTALPNDLKVVKVVKVVKVLKVLKVSASRSAPFPSSSRFLARAPSFSLFSFSPHPLSRLTLFPAPSLAPFSPPVPCRDFPFAFVLFPFCCSLTKNFSQSRKKLFYLL